MSLKHLNRSEPQELKFVLSCLNNYQSRFLYAYKFESQVWVLTGDKLETAVNIANSCGHFKRGMELLILSDPEKTEETLDELEYVLRLTFYLEK